MSTNKNSSSKNAVVRFLQGLRQRRASNQLLSRRQEASRSAESLALISNPAYKEAYQQSFNECIDRLMQFDPSTQQEQIIRTVIRMQAQEQVANTLNGFVRAAELEALRKHKQEQDNQ